MSGRGWRKWRSCGLYVTHPRSKSAHSHSEEHLIICGRGHNAYVTKLSRSTSQIPNKWNNNNRNDEERGISANEHPETPSDDDVIEWVDRRSLLPPSLGWYSPRGKNTNGVGVCYQNSFEQSMEARSYERSLERTFESSFQGDHFRREHKEYKEENGNNLLPNEENVFHHAYADGFKSKNGGTSRYSLPKEPFLLAKENLTTDAMVHFTKENQLQVTMTNNQLMVSIPCNNYDDNGNKIMNENSSSSVKYHDHQKQEDGRTKLPCYLNCDSNGDVEHGIPATNDERRSYFREYDKIPTDKHGFQDIDKKRIKKFSLQGNDFNQEKQFNFQDNNLNQDRKYNFVDNEKKQFKKTRFIDSGDDKTERKIFKNRDTKQTKRTYSQINNDQPIEFDPEFRKRNKKMRETPPLSLWQHHVWTSRDLRRYLVMKAKQTLSNDPQITPRNTGLEPLPSESTKNNELESSETGIGSSYTGRKLPSCLKRISSIRNESPASDAQTGSNSKSSDCLEHNLSAFNRLPKEEIISFGGTYFPRDFSAGGSLRLQKTHPAYRQHRLWSLPAIILTLSDDTPPSRNPSPPPPASRSSNASTISMQYLQVPQHAAALRGSSTARERRGSQDSDRSDRRKSTPAMKRRKSTSKSFEEIVGSKSGLTARQSLPTGFERTRSDSQLADPNKAEPYRRLDMKPSQLGSLLSLYGDGFSDDEDEDEDNDDRLYSSQRSGSPPPDLRPAIEELFDYEYEESFMYGRYSANLAEYARQEARKLRDEERHKDELLFSKELQPYRGRVVRATIKLIRPLWKRTFERLGEDWVFLFVLGLTMAVLSFLIDSVALACFEARMYLHRDLLADIHWSLQLFAWVLIPTLLVIFSAAFCQWLAPSAAGSGIPEMKTILRGVILKEYLTWRTLVAKIVGLSTVLGSGLPLGKEGPVMHMASIVSTMLMSVMKALKGAVDNEAHSTDLLAAACTMGVAVSYAAPIGGVLFSIEVTAVYFAVRNYWRGFFTAVLGTMFYRLMYVWFMNEKTISPLFKVEHNFLVPYDVVELLPFLCIGIVCGFAGSGFVYFHRQYVIFIRQNKTIKRLLNKKRLLYPTFVSIFISFTTFPAILGQFMATTISQKQQVLDLFSNVTWSALPGEELTLQQTNIIQHWGYPTVNWHFGLFIFQIVSIIEVAIASTLPVPSGLLIPLFKVGASFGRQIGEFMYYLFPAGIKQTNLYPIVPGAYAMVGAASFCASITHTISISVVVFELTGQITYVIPIMIGVLISNCIASLLQPSIYDSVIQIKKLPYLPDIVTTSSDVYHIYVEDIMVRDVKYIWKDITFMDLKKVLKENRKLKYFPFVDTHETLILLGSISRIELVRLLVQQISSEKRRNEAKSRHLEALKKRWEEEDLQGLNKGKSKSKIRYENELNSSSDDEEEGPKNGIFGSLSKSLSKSLLSLTRFKHDSPDSSEDEAQPAEKKDNMNNNSPPVSPTINKLRDLFSSKTPVERTDSRFSVSKVNNASPEKIKFTIGSTEDEDAADEEETNRQNKPTTKASDESETVEGSPKPDQKSPKSDEESQKPGEESPKSDNESPKSDNESPKSDKGSPKSDKGSTAQLKELQKKKSKLELFKDTKNRMRNKMGVKEQLMKPKIRLTRSNSLDSLRKIGILQPDIGDSVSVTTTIPSCPGTPNKGILKRRNSFSLGNLRTPPSAAFLSVPDDANYSTINVVDTKLRNAIEKVRKMKAETASNMELKLSTISLFKNKKKEHGKKREFDMTPEEREVWELRELSKEVDFSGCHVDPSPFQLVERTSLLRVHSLFSMLGINHAFVTAIGRLVGVVAIKELRHAIEGQYVGRTHSSSAATSPTTDKPSSPTSPTSPVNKGFLTGTSPQRLSAIPPYMTQLDPEAGPVYRRSVSSNQLSPYPNGFANS